MKVIDIQSVQILNVSVKNRIQLAFVSSFREEAVLNHVSAVEFESLTYPLAAKFDPRRPNKRQLQVLEIGWSIQFISLRLVLLNLSDKLLILRLSSLGFPLLHLPPIIEFLLLLNDDLLWTRIRNFKHLVVLSFLAFLFGHCLLFGLGLSGGHVPF